MRLKIDICIAASMAFAIIIFVSFWAFSSLFAEASIFYIGLPFALSVFFFSLTVLRRDSQQWIFEVSRLQIVDLLIYILTITSIIIVLTVPAYEGSMLEWMNIPPLNWLRYLSSLLLTSILPGYFLLKTLDRKHVITGSIVIVLSYLLSLFITLLAGFFILLSASPLAVAGLPIIITANIALLIIHYFTNREKPPSYLLTVDWPELGLILSVLAVITVGSVLVMSSNMPLTSGDMVRHYGTALDLSKGFPVYGGIMVTYAGGYFFAIYLNALFVLCGIPPALAEQGLYVLSFMPLLAFYSAIKVWFSKNRDKRFPLVATTFSLLLGFGGLYALHLKFANPSLGIIQLLSTATSRTYDVYMRILYLPDIVAPIWSVGLPVFFTLLYFLRKECSRLIRFAIIPIVVSLGYVAHTSEIVIFALILFLFAVFLKSGDGVKTGPYLFLGLIIVALIDLIAPAHVYIMSAASTSVSVAFVATLTLALLATVIEMAKSRRKFVFFSKLKTAFLEGLKKNWQYYGLLLLYIYTFFLVTWLSLASDFDVGVWTRFEFTPFFVFPLR
jgi:hypothetical protein